MNPNTRSIVAVFIAALAVVSTAALPAMAAQPTLDTTDDGDGTTGVDPTTTFVYNESANNTATLQFNADTANASVTIKQDGDTVYQNESVRTVNASGNIYAVEIDPETDLDDVEAEGGENVTLGVYVANDSTLENPDELAINVSYENADDRAVENIDDSDADADAEFTAPMISLASIPYVGDDNVTKSTEFTDNTTVNATSATVTYNIENTTMSDAYTESLSDEDHESGDWVPTTYAKVNGQYIPVFKSESGSPDWLDSDESYAVANDETVTLHLENDTIDSAGEEVDIVLGANDKMGFRNAQAMFSDYGLSSTYERIKLSLSALDTDAYLEG